MRAVLLDIEGTTTEIAYVHRVLFPYARARLPAWVCAHAHDPQIAAAIAQIRAEVGGATLSEAVGTLIGWIDADRKAPPLKTIQGRIWAQGYADGSLKSHVYPDVAPALARWRAAGVRVACYSSGSVLAQQQLFAHSIAGDLAGFFERWFDTATGSKREEASYARIVAALEIPAAEVVFCSDVVEELDAAAGAGLAAVQVVRPGTTPGRTDRIVGGLDEL